MLLVCTAKCDNLCQLIEAVCHLIQWYMYSILCEKFRVLQTSKVRLSKKYITIKQVYLVGGTFTPVYENLVDCWLESQVGDGWF